MMACNGNMEAIPQTTNPTLLLGGTYDAWNRLVKLSEPPASAGGDPTPVAEYEYDGRNYRIVKKVYVDGVFDHDEHQYLSNSNQVLEVRHDGSTTAAMQYIWGERYIDDLILRDRTTTNPLDERLYCLQDANWNTVALVDDGGSVVQTFDYQPYGECTYLTSSYGASTNLYAWTTLFTGRELDPESELYYFRARYLHAKVGTFLSRDPLGYVDGMSLVRAWFVPNAVDPLGRESIDECRKLFPQPLLKTKDDQQAVEDWYDCFKKHSKDPRKIPGCMLGKVGNKVSKDINIWMATLAACITSDQGDPCQWGTMVDVTKPDMPRVSRPKYDEKQRDKCMRDSPYTFNFKEHKWDNDRRPAELHCVACCDFMDQVSAWNAIANIQEALQTVFEGTFNKVDCHSSCVGAA